MSVSENVFHSDSLLFIETCGSSLITIMKLINNWDYASEKTCEKLQLSFILNLHFAYWKFCYIIFLSISFINDWWLNFLWPKSTVLSFFCNASKQKSVNRKNSKSSLILYRSITFLFYFMSLNSNLMFESLNVWI